MSHSSFYRYKQKLMLLVLRTFLVNEKIDGTLMPPDGPDSWPKNNSRRQWLVFYRINEMSLQGGGLIDGRGEKWWNLPCKPHKVLLIFNMLIIMWLEQYLIPYIQMTQGINGTTVPGPCDSPIVS